MNGTDRQFIEEYEKLDAVLCEMYGKDKGVTSYIEEMESVKEPAIIGNLGWQDEYRNLRRLRQLFNQISKYSGSGKFAEEYEVDMIRDFHSRLLSRKDALSFFEQQMYFPQEEQEKRPPVQEIKIEKHDSLNEDPAGNRLSRKYLILLLIFISVFFVTGILLLTGKI